MHIFVASLYCDNTSQYNYAFTTYIGPLCQDFKKIGFQIPYKFGIYWHKNFRNGTVFPDAPGQ